MLLPLMSTVGKKKWHDPRGGRKHLSSKSGRYVKFRVCISTIEGLRSRSRPTKPQTAVVISFVSQSRTMALQHSLFALFVCFQSVVAFAPCRVVRSPTFRQAAMMELPEGLIKTVSKPGTGPPLKLGDVASVKYSCYLHDDESKAPFARSDFQKVVCLSPKGSLSKNAHTHTLYLTL
jgi:hypothetical protein